MNSSVIKYFDLLLLVFVTLSQLVNYIHADNTLIQKMKNKNLKIL